MKAKYNVAVVGATGAVGEQMLRSLELIKFPVKEIKLLSSKRSAGRTREFQGREVIVEEARPESFEGIDIALFSAGGEVSKVLIPEAVKRGAVCIDNTSYFRMDKDVPLVVPEVNPQDIKKHNGIIANPNCSTIQMVAVLEPLRKAFGLKKVIVSTYQAVSGAGIVAIDELHRQTECVLNNQEVNPKVLPVKSGAKHHQIAFNCIPQIDTFHENGFTLEEMKMINETKKIMHMEDLQVTATCVRVPVITGHSESVYVEFDRDDISIEEVKEVLKGAAGVVLQDDLNKQLYPLATTSVGLNDVFVGRVRKNLGGTDGFSMWIVSDNLLKGAAWNSVQIAECLMNEK